MATFFCKLVPPRPTFMRDMTPSEFAVMQRHVSYWKDLMDKGVRILALGPVADPAGAFGVGIIEAEDEGAMRCFAAADPAITADAGMHYEIHPMLRGAVHSPR